MNCSPTSDFTAAPWSAKAPDIRGGATRRMVGGRPSLDTARSMITSPEKSAAIWAYPHREAEEPPMRFPASSPNERSSEALLLLRIRQPLPEPMQSRLRAIIDLRDARELTSEEHTELLALSDEAERYEAERVEALATLAAGKGIP